MFEPINDADVVDAQMIEESDELIDIVWSLRMAGMSSRGISELLDVELAEVRAIVDFRRDDYCGPLVAEMIRL